MVIKKGKMTIHDALNRIVKVEKGFTCGCGDPKYEVMGHIDAVDWYSTKYRCQCGNLIAVRHERDKEDKWW